MNTEKTLIIFTYGSCFPNPGGIMGIGMVCYEAEDFSAELLGTKEVKSKYSSIKRTHQHSEKITEFEESTNNIAEHIAMLLALEYAKDKENKTVYIFSDSDLVVNQTKGKWKINYEKEYSRHAIKSKRIVKEISETKSVNIFWIPRELNKIADSLSK